jgi:hypothetical protein
VPRSPCRSRVVPALDGTGVFVYLVDDQLASKWLRTTTCQAGTSRRPTSIPAEYSSPECSAPDPGPGPKPHHRWQTIAMSKVEVAGRCWLLEERRREVAQFNKTIWMRSPRPHEVITKSLPRTQCSQGSIDSMSVFQNKNCDCTTCFLPRTISTIRYLAHSDLFHQNASPGLRADAFWCIPLRGTFYVHLRSGKY